MKRRIVIILIIIFLFLIYGFYKFILNPFGYIGINKTNNASICLEIENISIRSKCLTEIIDTSCQVDSDCKLEVPSDLLECRLCDPYNCKNYAFEDEEVVAINKNWNPGCPQEPLGGDRLCLACSGGWGGFNFHEAKCIENKCMKVSG